LHPIQIGHKTIGPRQPTFIIAEIGINHNGDPETALQMVEEAARCGADAVKFQTFQADKLLSKDTAKAKYVEASTGEEESFYDMFKRLELSEKTYEEIAQLCRSLGLIFLSTPFDYDSMNLLVDLGVPAFKVASGDLTNLPFLKALAFKKLPLLVSTGMSTLGEVEEAVITIENFGDRSKLILLHCTSNYPPSIEDINLRAMVTMENAFRVPVGYSDHTRGITTAIAAVTLGACVLEKHFTLDKSMPGPDQALSSDPAEMTALVEAMRGVEKALGSPIKAPVEAEIEIRQIGRRSVVAARPILKGTKITPEMVTVKRPGSGIAPKDTDLVIGRYAKVDLDDDEVITWDKIG